MKYRILLVGNTVEKAGGWHVYQRCLRLLNSFGTHVFDIFGALFLALGPRSLFSFCQNVAVWAAAAAAAKKRLEKLVSIHRDLALSARAVIRQVFEVSSCYCFPEYIVKLLLILTNKNRFYYKFRFLEFLGSDSLKNVFILSIIYKLKSNSKALKFLLFKNLNRKEKNLKQLKAVNYCEVWKSNTSYLWGLEKKFHFGIWNVSTTNTFIW